MSKPRVSAEQAAARAKMRAETGRRLHLVRRVLDLTQEEFARPAGISGHAYSMIESGDRLPSIEVAVALCSAHRITMDWIFRGEPGDMSVRLWEGVRALMAVTDEQH
jgi:DNA-binding XRE family transcriptional regulator